ncbi:hypothetical protein JSY36_19105 [Bacillus sp. H-16]|uniref:hypothetical protein n=1 Tax=Alteribacter salitolerans TaxID=2912333 RepID=UPI001966AA02|nr:hypothetical protein [Alteribacter salitolerans]MBM7097849.1 hypothetical protein [Alteribacter salitolerans]
MKKRTCPVVVLTSLLAYEEANGEGRAARGKCKERKSAPDFTETILKKIDFFSGLAEYDEEHQRSEERECNGPQINT